MQPNNLQPDNRNLFIAMALSVVILVFWQFFFINPQMEAERARLEQEEARRLAAEQQTETAADPAAPTVQMPQAPGASAQAPASTEPVAGEPVNAGRLVIDTSKVDGSINLLGARIDDLNLKDYRETIDPESPEIRVLHPADTPNAYFAEFGWLRAGSAVGEPGAATVWTAETTGPLTENSPAVLSFEKDGLRFIRTISVDDGYLFTVTDTIENTGGEAVTLYPYGLVSRMGTPKLTGIWILHEGLIGVAGDDGLMEVDYSQVREEREIKATPAANGWYGITDKYWAAAIVPPAGTTVNGRFAWDNSAGRDRYQADYLGEAVTVQPGARQSVESRLFAGAKQGKLIDTYEADYSIDRFELLIDWGWFYFITKPLFYILDWLFHYFGNFGVAILIATVGIKLVFFPLANKSYESMSMMKKVQPEMEQIRERFKDDRQAQQKELMELYKREKINPAAGCLPILLQIPVFFALYKVLYVTIEMRHAPFFGWIQDLAAPDPTTIFNLFGLLPYDLPVWVPLLGIWPIFMGLTMFVQMKLNPAPPDKTQAMIFNWMPVIFTVMLATFPAGLVIYWAWNNLLSILQQYVIMRRFGVKVEILKNIKDTFRKSSSGEAKKPAE